MKVNICGLPHEIIEVEDTFSSDCMLGLFEYNSMSIKINKDVSEELKSEILCHEMLHGILLHLGYTELGENETLVQSLGNAINQSFSIKYD